MRHCLLGSVLFIGLSACLPPETNSSNQAQHLFIGCWENDDKTSQEEWTLDPSGWLVGYSANRDEQGSVTFFEHMRIEIYGGSQILVVTGQDGTQTAFKRVETDNSSVFRFENPDHDFPQVITYEPTPGRLDAWISALDGSDQVKFEKAACSS